MTANDADRRALPAARYGTAPSRRRRLVAIIAGAILAAAAVGWLGWVALYHANPPVRATVLGYRVVSPSAVEISFELVKDPDVAAVCALRARNQLGEEVGRRPINIPTGGPRRRVLQETLATRDLAILGEVRECRSVP